jgi:excisionase family DNA binding protein
MPVQTVALLDEDTLTLTQAARQLGVSVASTWRWAREGFHGVRLDYVRIGRRILTSKQALQRFADALTAQDQRRTEPVISAQDAGGDRDFDSEAEAEGL